MRPLRKVVLLVVAGLTAGGTLSYRSDLDYLSCAGCRSFRYVSTRSIFGIPFSHSERVELASSIPGGHVHEWWRYSLHTSTLLSTTLACKVHRFADGKDSD